MKKCGCKAEIERLRGELADALDAKAQAEAQILVLIALDERRREADKSFGKQLVEARGLVSDRKADL